MDIYCPRCGEPWDLDSLHEAVSERYENAEWYTDGAYDQKKYDRLFQEVRAEFRKNGCSVFGTKCSTSTASPLIAEILDLAGDDIDGACSDLDDARSAGLI